MLPLLLFCTTWSLLVPWRQFAPHLGWCVGLPKGPIRSHTCMKLHSSSFEAGGKEEMLQKICLSFACCRLHSFRVHCIFYMNTPETLCARLVSSVNLRNLFVQGWPESAAWRPVTYFLQRVSFSSTFILVWWECLVWHWVLYPWCDILKLNHQS